MRSLIYALILTGAAIFLALSAGPDPSIHDNYLKFCTWDCGWYTSIVSQGYHSVIPPIGQDSRFSNVAFFPGYPLIARALHLAFGMTDPRLPLIFTAHFFCVLFWLAFLLILKRWKVHPYLQLLAVLAVFVHPAAFFLVTGYSESVFLASLLFFFYWSDHEDPGQRWWAVLPGFLMTATRIVGLPVAAYPLFRWLAGARGREDFRPRALLQPALIAGLSALGCLLFLAYCQFKFGDYRLYMQTQKVGWGIVPDYTAIWQWGHFNYFRPYEEVATISSGIGLACFWVLELGWAAHARARPNPVRVPLYFSATLIFYITLSGLKTLWFRSMIRYTLPWWLLLVLCLAHLSTQARREPDPLAIPLIPPRFSGLFARIALTAGVGSLAVIYYYFQLPHLIDFLSSVWFA